MINRCRSSISPADTNFLSYVAYACADYRLGDLMEEACALPARVRDKAQTLLNGIRDPDTSKRTRARAQSRLHRLLHAFGCDDCFIDALLEVDLAEYRARHCVNSQEWRVRQIELARRARKS